MTKKPQKKMIICLICATLALLILIGSVVGGTMMFRDKIYLLMPPSFICKQIEKEIPIGSDADEVIEYLKSKDEWLPEENASDSNDKDYRIYQTGTGHYIASYYGHFYSFSKLDYKSHDQGCYITSAYLGIFPNKDTTLWSAYDVEACFVFDENLKLIDIYVFRRYAGF